MAALIGCLPTTVVAQRAPARAARADADPALVAAIRDQAKGELKRFYADRGFRPLWAIGGRLDERAEQLIGYLRSADFDGLRPRSYDPDKLQDIVAEAAGDPRRIAKAELALSAVFAKYVRDQRKPRARMTYADETLEPRQPDAGTALRTAALAPSLDRYLADMGWMSPHYVRLRRLSGEAELRDVADADRDRLRLNLERARLLPGPWTPHIVVDASSGQLWYYGAGRQLGTMRVVVGAPETPTPMLAGRLNWAILNPYWNVPDYLVRDNIAPKVLSGRSLKTMRMEALTDWTPDARPLPASAVDWHAVAAGEQEVRVRELPHPANSMGKVKFLFPNDDGIYLHDTPQRDLLRREDRHLSNGCIRLEDAAKLGQWLLQRPVRARTRAPEQPVALPVPIPVYLTYLTATATDRGLAFRPDVYGRDG